MTLREALQTADLDKVYDAIQSRERGGLCDPPSLEWIEENYGNVVKELLAKPKVKAYSMPFYVEDTIDPFDKTPMIDLYLRNRRYVKPPKGFKHWGGKRGQKIPKGYYNINLNKYNLRFSTSGVRWSKLIDTPIEIKSKASLEEILAVILFDITFDGFTEEKCVENTAILINKLDEAAKDIKEGKFITLPPKKKGGMKVCIPDSVTQQIIDLCNKPVKRNKEPNTCKTCLGYGLWAMGDECPMGPMDASDGMPTKACPECGANPNPYK